MKKKVPQAKKVAKKPKKKLQVKAKRKTVKKMKKVMRKVTRPVLRKIAAPMVKKSMGAAARRQKRALVTKVAKKVQERLIGKVIHYYDRIGVAIVDLKEPLRVGDMVRLKRGDEEFLQRVFSLQIEHQDVAMARPGDSVGMKVDRAVKEGTVMVPA